MKTMFKSIMAIALAAMTFAACEDVPEPYPTPVLSPESGEQEEVPAIDAENTIETALTVAEALAIINDLGDGKTTAKPYYLKGRVSSILTTGDDVAKYKNINYYITDASNNKIQVYKGRNLNNTDFTEDGQLKVGDEVIVVGKLMKYKNNNTGAIVPEVADGNYIVEIKSGSGEAPAVDAANTKETAITVGEAINLINELAEGATTPKFYYVKGKISRISTKGADIAKYKNINYYIKDEQGNEIQVYKGRNLNNTDFTEEGQINVGDQVIVVGPLMKYKNTNTGATVPEIADGNYIVELTAGGGEETPAIDAVNTMETAISTTEAVNIINALAEGATTDKYYYVKGTISKINTTGADVAKYKNINYYIKDGQGQEIQVYKGRNLDNTDFTEDGQINIGDEVIVVGKLMKYKNTKTGDVIPEIADGNYIVKLTKGEGGSNPPAPSSELGTLQNPITVAKALEVINALEDNAETATEAYVSGTVVSVVSINTKYGSLTYYISDDGTANQQLQVYGGLGMNASKFNATSDLAVGAKVIVKGKLKKYVKDSQVTPEFNLNSEIVSLDGQTSGGGDTPGEGSQSGIGTVEGNTITVSAGALNVGNGEAVPTITLADGTKLLFDGGGNNNAPKFYTSGGDAVRMYPKNTMTVTATKAIAQVELTCVANNAEGQVSASAGTVAVSDMTVTVNGVNGQTTTITNNNTNTGAASQLRIGTIKITYQ